jgi:hypothetical protein
MIARKHLDELTMRELIGEAIRNEVELLNFYAAAVPVAGYDIQGLFRKFEDETRGRLKALEEKAGEVVLLGELTEPIAD